MVQNAGYGLKNGQKKKRERLKIVPICLFLGSFFARIE